MMQSLQALGVTSPINYRLRLSIGKAPLLFVTWKTQSLDSSKMSGFSLAHPHALQMLRTRLLERLQPQLLQNQKPALNRPTIVVASRGDSTGMRHFDENSLVGALSLAMPGHDVVLSNGSQPLFDNLALFAAASAVVGVHGGALANIVVCSASIPLVEIGFASEASLALRTCCQRAAAALCACVGRRRPAASIGWRCRNIRQYLSCRAPLEADDSRHPQYRDCRAVKTKFKTDQYSAHFSASLRCDNTMNKQHASRGRGIRLKVSSLE